MEQLAVIQFILSAVLLLTALAVRFAGERRILNIVDYARVADIGALHRWASNRLLALPLLSLLLAWSSNENPQFALPLFIAFACFVLAVVVWLAAGTSKFYAHPGRRAGG